jgi:hypothetical protein
MKRDFTDAAIGAATGIAALMLDVEIGDVGPFGGFIEQCDAIADLAAPPP